jgi:hypothetical protein
MLCEHAVHRRHERRFIGHVPFPPPSGGSEKEVFS